MGLAFSGRIPHDIAEPMLKILAKEKPDVFTFLHQRYQEIIPPVIFKDYTLIPLFLTDFCNYLNINPEHLKGHEGVKGVAMKSRKMFLALLMLCYHPEKIEDITDKRVWQGLELYAAHYLNCTDKALANMISEVIISFKFYPDFYNPVKEAHALIVERHRLRAGDKVRAYQGFTKKAPVQQLDIFKD